jgi:hypothetical protein
MTVLQSKKAAPLGAASPVNAKKAEPPWPGLLALEYVFGYVILTPPRRQRESSEFLLSVTYNRNL